MLNNFKISNGMKDPLSPKDAVCPEKDLSKYCFFCKKSGFFVLGVFIFLFFLNLFFLSAPKDFPQGIIFKIESGASLRSISLGLQQEHVIRSRVAFEFFVILFGGEKHIPYSDYLFEKKLPVYEIARRISKGERHMAPIMVTIPEGFDISQIAETFSQKLTNFNKEKFIASAAVKEGFLFPDTYYFFSIDDEQDVFKAMSNNFEKKIEPLRLQIKSMNKTEKEIIIMASIIEGEAKGNNDRGYISGILWKRLSIGMPLQVDVSPETYKTKGLPKSPVGNPGLLAIKAAIYPQNSSYLYYLHDKNGNIHYASTFAEHVQNKLRYFPPKADQP